MTRNPFKAVLGTLLVAVVLGCVPAEAVGGQRTAPDFASLERRFDARLGVDAIDTGSGAEITHRADQRWAYCSTMKVFAAAEVLRRNPSEGLNRRITYGHADLVTNSPVTEQHVDDGMTLRELLRAAVRESDNTAQNLLLRELGGPAGLRRALRAFGDDTSHADRYEPELTETAPGDIRDTSTPRALATDLRRVVLGDVLPGQHRAMLRSDMRDSPLTAKLIQAGMPRDWGIEDKSGAGDYATRNDIAVLYPPHRAPIVLVLLTDRARKTAQYDDALIADAARVTIDALR